MARPRISKATILAIYRLRGLGKTIDQILDDLEDTIARGTIAKYTKQYDNFPDSIKMQHQNIEWHRIQDYGLPWEAVQFLMETWYRIQDSVLSAVVRLPPTGTQARWWWFVHCAAPEVNNILDIVAIAERFIIREMLHQMLNDPLELDDLYAHLAYKPWLDKQRRAVYLKAVETGQIPPLSLNQVTVHAASAAELTGVDRSKAVLLAMVCVGMVYPLAPELLLSQQIEHLNESNPESTVFSLTVMPEENSNQGANLTINFPSNQMEIDPLERRNG